MDKRKLLVIVGIMAVLGITFLILGRILSDDTEPAYSDMLQAQATVNQLSDVATDQASNPSTRNLAAMILSTTTTDYNRLAAISTARYDTVADEADPQAIEELETTREDFDFRYRELVREYLETSLDRLEFFIQNTSDAEELQAFEAARDNQQSYLERLAE